MKITPPPQKRPQVSNAMETALAQLRGIEVVLDIDEATLERLAKEDKLWIDHKETCKTLQ